MKIAVNTISASKSTIDTALDITIGIEYLYRLELPLYITGKLSMQGKIIAVLHDARITSNFLEIKINNAEDERAMRTNTFSVILTAPISHKVIDYIENVREKQENKTVVFECDFDIKYLTLPMTQNYNMQLSSGDIQLNLGTCNTRLSYSISQSDWIQKFAAPLGIGNYILLELAIPEITKIDPYWEELYQKMYQRVQDMEDAIKKGEWKLVMVAGRQFYENVKSGDNKSNDKRFEEALRKRFLKDNHTDEGVTSLFNGIYNFFEFESKYFHDKDRKQQIQSTPNYTKEDAYFIYTLSIGLFNLIAKKLSDI